MSKVEEITEIGYVSLFKDMLGRPIAVGDEILAKVDYNRSAKFLRATVYAVPSELSKKKSRLKILFQNETVPRVKEHSRILVINDQLKANARDYPEEYV